MNGPVGARILTAFVVAFGIGTTVYYAVYPVMTIVAVTSGGLEKMGPGWDAAAPRIQVIGAIVGAFIGAVAGWILGGRDSSTSTTH